MSAKQNRGGGGKKKRNIINEKKWRINIVQVHNQDEPCQL